MNKITYLQTLNHLLASLPSDEQQEIMYDYEEHFRESLKEGLSEDEIIKSLGPAKDIAKRYLTTITIANKGPIPKADASYSNHQNIGTPPVIPPKGNNPVTRIVLFFLVLLFTVIFIITWYIPLWAIVIVFFTVSIVFEFLGFTLLISGIFSVPITIITIPVILVQHPLLIFTTSVAFICIGGLVIILNYYIAKFLCFLAYHYVKQSLRFIRGY
jgi:uncharacterized membrane protein